MAIAVPKLRKDIIDIVFPGMKESELLKWIETDFESFWKQWGKQPSTDASRELLTELQSLYPDKFPDIPLAEEEPLEIPLEEEEPPVELTPEEVVKLPTTLTQDGWEFRDIAWDIKGEAINYRAISPTGEEFTKAELEEALMQQEELAPQEAQIIESFQKVFPTVEDPIEALIWAGESEENWVELQELIFRIGRTEDTVALLKTLAPEATTEDIEGFFGVEAEPTLEESTIRLQAELQPQIQQELTRIDAMEDLSMEERVQLKDEVSQEYRTMLGITETHIERLGRLTTEGIPIEEYESFPPEQRRALETLVTGKYPWIRMYRETIGGVVHLRSPDPYAGLSPYQKINRMVIDVYKAPFLEIAGVPISLEDIVSLGLLASFAYIGVTGTYDVFVKRFVNDLKIKRVWHKTDTYKALKPLFETPKGKTLEKDILAIRTLIQAGRIEEATPKMRELFPRLQEIHRGLFPARPTMITPTPGVPPVTPRPPSTAITLALTGAPRETSTALTRVSDAIISQGLTAEQITVAFIANYIPAGVTLEKTASLISQLEGLGHTTEAITAMSPEEAWANLFKAPVTPAVAPPVAPEVIPPTPPMAEVAAVYPIRPPITRADWARLSIPDRVDLVKSLGLAETAASKSWANLSSVERGVLTNPLPELPVVPEAVPEVKQPWQMTQQEYIDDFLAKRKPTDKLLARTMAERLTMERQVHRNIVRQALSEGQPVPTEVLAEYPDLKPPAVPPVKPPVIPIAEPGLPEAGLQPSLIEGVPAREIRPEAKAAIVQAKLGDYLKLKKYEETQVANRLDEIKRLLATKGRLPKGQGTKPELRIEQARLEAQQKVDQATSAEHLQLAIDDIQTELGNRSMPYHGRAPNIFPDKTAKQLDEMLKVYEEARNQLLPKEALKPVAPLPATTAEEATTNLATTGSPTLTPAQAERTLDLFGKYVTAPSTENAWELTRQLRRDTRAGRAENLKARSQQLIIERGVSPEEAISQAIRETMSGELPIARADYLDDLTQEMRDALFSKLYHTLKDEPLEMASTHTALMNALLGKPIPREPGIRGGSAYTRLQRVFGDQPEAFEAITKGAREGTPLPHVVESLYMEVGKPPLPIDEKTAEWLRTLSNRPYGKGTLFEKPTDLTVNELRTPVELEYAQRKLELDVQLTEGKITKDAHDIEVLQAYDKAYPKPPIPPYEPPIEKAIAQMPLWPRPASDMIIKFLKEMAWSPVDIGNALRANIASFDMSFWRQQGPLIANHPIAFSYANIEAFKALVSQKVAEASFERITRDPLYQIYAVAAERGYDFLRPLILPPGTSQWLGTEEFGYITQERLIPRLTGKIPHVKLSSRAFVTGTNEHNWRIFKNHYKAMLREGEMYASGELTLKPGKVFSVEKEMIDMARMLADFTQRASLGKVSGLSAAMSGLMFAPRATLGRILTPRHLVSANPRIRKEAWRNLSLWVAVLGGILLLGEKLDLWEVEKDPRSAEFMSARIGNTRFDFWSGHRQFLVFYTRVATGSGVSSVTGAEYDVDPIGAMTSMARGKASPMASIFLDFWTGRNFIGEEVDVANPEQWLDRLMPFALRDIYEAYKDDPTMAWPVAIPAILGAGVQTYTGDWRENWSKLGLPKYSDNLVYGLTEPVYDAGDFWSDTASRFKGVAPETLTEEKGYPPYIRAIAEAYNEILPELDALPNQKLISINATPEEGTTFGQYYQMWLDREKIVASGDEEALKEFDADERTRNANLGNMSQRQYSLLVKYHSFTDKKEQEEWLAGLDEESRNSITENPRQSWLKSHPKENAQLAVWGQAKILTMEAYKETQRLIKELDIPDNAIPEQTLPPEGSVENYFKYLEQGEELGYNSWEVQLIIVQDDDLRIFLDRQLIDTPVEALELKIKHRDAYDLEKEYSDRDNPLYIDDAEDRKDKLIELLGEEKYQEWVDDKRRIEAIEHDGLEYQDKWVERGGKVDEFGGTSSEAILWLVENPDVYDWAVENELLEDNREENRAREPILRINVDYATEDDWYNEGIPTRHAEVAYKNIAARDAGIAEERSRYLADNPEYNKARYRRDAYGLKDKNFNPFPDELIETYVDYYTNPDLKKPDDWKETSGTDEWYEDDWFLQENPEFHQALVDYGKFTELRDLSKVPPREVFTLYQEYLGIEGSQERLNFRHEHEKTLDAWLVEAKGLKPVGDRWTPSPELANKKYWLEQAHHFKGLLADLGIPEDITVEELTDEQFELIKKAIKAFYD